MDTFEIVGVLHRINSEKIKGMESKTSETGWNTKTCRFNVKSGNNNIMTQIKGGVRVVEKDGKTKVSPDQKVYTRSKGDGNIKGENIEISWADRNKEDVIANVAAFKKLTIDKETPDDRKKLNKIRKTINDGNALTDEDYKFLGVDNLDAAAETIKSRAKIEYLHEWDYATAVNKFLETANGMYKVSGNVEISFDMQNNVAYKNYSVTKIEKVNDDAEPYAHVSLDFYYNKNVLDLTDWKETQGEKKTPDISGTAIANGKQMFYFNDKKYGIKGNFATDISFEIPGISTNYSIKSRFSKPFEKDVEWKLIRLNLDIIDGAQEVELTEDMLTEDQLLDIECGAYTIEDIKADMGAKIFGERVRKYTFSKLTDRSKSEEDTSFTDEDMLPPHTTESESSEDADDIFDDDDI